MREGVHPEYEEQLQYLIERREQMLEKAKLYRDYRLECVEKMFEAEIKQVEKDYMVWLLNDFYSDLLSSSFKNNAFFNC